MVVEEMDRAYQDFARLYALDQAGSFIATRAKRNMNARRLYSAPVDRGTGFHLKPEPLLPETELQSGISNVTNPYLPRPLSLIQVSGSTMARTVADQFAEVPAAAGVDQIYDLARTICDASGKLS